MNDKMFFNYKKFEDYLFKFTKNSTQSEEILIILRKTQIPYLAFIRGMATYKEIFDKINSEKSPKIYKKGEYGEFYIRSERFSSSNVYDANTLINTSQKTLSVSSFLSSVFENSFLSIISCCIISCKYYTDIAFTNESWCVILKINLIELNRIEREILELTNYKIGESKIIETEIELNSAIRSEIIFDDQLSTTRKGKKKFLKKIFCMK